MRIIIIIILVFTLTQPTYSQKDSSALFFNEYSFSVYKPLHNRHYFDKDNYRSSLYPYYDTLRIGFGIGAYHFKPVYNWLEIKFGTEFNLLRRYEYIQGMSHWGHYSNIEFSLFYLDFPLSLRVLAGNKYKVFFEYGGSLGINYTHLSYDYYSIHPDPNTFTPVVSTGHINEGGFYNPLLNFSVFSGLGIIFPLMKHEFILQGQILNNLNGTYSEIYYPEYRYEPICMRFIADWRFR